MQQSLSFTVLGDVFRVIKLGAGRVALRDSASCSIALAAF